MIRFTLCVCQFGLFALPAQAAFTSLYVFGDGVCTTTTGPGGSSYYGRSYSNGRIWIEVLAQRQGLAYESNKNWSYFGHSSSDLVVNVGNFAAPPDAGTALFVIWVDDADFVYNVQNYGTNSTTWRNALNRSLTNHFKALTNLYAKGARTVVMPNAVDLTKAPNYVGTAAGVKSFIRQRVIEFNSGFAATVNQAMASLPGLEIYVPDVFSLLDDVVANPADYGLTNALYRGQSIAALDDPALNNKALNGPGTNYIFWDYLDPTAKFHAVLADEVQQLITPVQFRALTALGGSTRLELANIPVGRNGFVESSSDFVIWTTAASIVSTNVTQSGVVPDTEPLQFYRLRFPFAWTWP